MRAAPIRIVRLARRCSRAHELGEDADEDNAQGGQTSAYQTDGDFDRGPPDDFGLCPGRVVGNGEVDDGLQAQTRHDGDEGADAEHDCYADFLAPRELEVEDLVEGEREHPDVEEDADDGVAPGERVDVDALAGVLAVPGGPEVGDWAALENCGDDEGEAADDVDGDGGPEEASDQWLREDA